jgi:hypothetical protein
MKIRVLLTITLSFIPGLAHMYLGRYKKGLGLLCVSVAAIVGWLFSAAIIIKCLMTVVYLVTAIPAALETLQIARGRQAALYTSQRWYIILLLLTTGFPALFLLWQSSYFSPKSKIAWTVAVPVLAVLFFTCLAAYWNQVEGFLERHI